MIDSIVTTNLVQRLLGRAMVVCVLNRCGMSVFRRLYDFVERLTRQEANECRVFIGILPLLVGNPSAGAV